MIKLRQLILENFLSHKETEIEFGDETYVILGDNASGKTSILRGIFFAIFGEDLKEKTNKDQLINRRANTSRVELEFIHRGKRYRVFRELSRRRNVAKLEKEGKLVARGIREVRSYIAENLGLAPDMFKNTVFVPQGEIVELLRGRPQERRKILNRLLGLEEFGKKHEELKEEIKKLKGFEGLLATKLSALENTEREIEEQKRKIKELKETITLLKVEVSKLKEKLQKGKEEFEELRRIKEEFERTKREIQQLVQNREKLERKKTEIEQKLRNINSRKKIIPQLQEEVKLLKPCEELNSLIQELKPVVVEKEKLEKELERLKEGIASRERLEKEIPLLEKDISEVENSISNLVNERQKLEKELEEFRKIEKIFRELSTRKLSIEEQAERIKQKLPDISYKEVEKLELQLKDLEEKVKSIERKRENLLDTIVNLDEKLKILEKDTSQCPVCGSELSPEKREKLRTETEEELERSKKELIDTEEKLKTLKERLERTKITLEKRKEELISKQKGEEELRKLEEELLKIEKNIPQFEEAKLKEKEKNLEDIRNRIFQLENRRTLIKAKLEEFRKQLAKLPEKDNLKEVENHLENLVKKEQSIRNQIKKIKKLHNINVSSSSQLKQLIEKLREKQKTLHEIEGEIRNESEFKNLLNQYQSEIEETLKKEKDLYHYIEKLNFKENIYQIAERSIKSMEEEFQTKSERLNRLIGELKGAEETLVKLEERKKELEGLKRNLSKVKDSLLILQNVQESIHPEKGFLKDVRSMLLPRISYYCKEFFSAFDFEFGDLFISEDLSVEFGMPGQGTMLIEDLSGGQQVAFALALRFAMARNFSQSMELLVLDEPTVHLDAQRRMGLTELLMRLKSRIPQMLIVTHDPELEVAGDRVIRVKSHGGYSVVEPGE